MISGWNFNFYHFAIAWPIGDGAGFATCASESRDALHWADEIDKIGDVIGAHIQHWPTAGIEKEIWIWVPHFHARPHEMTGAGKHLADHPIINGFAGLLMRSAQECIRC